MECWELTMSQWSSDDGGPEAFKRGLVVMVTGQSKSDVGDM